MQESKSVRPNPNLTSENQPLPKLAYSPEEAAKVIGVCRDTIYRLLKRGVLRSSSALRHKVIPHTEIERFLKSTLN